MILNTVTEMNLGDISDPIFQSYSERIWSNLRVQQISNFMFSYNSLSPGKNINFGKNKTLNQILKAII